MTFLGRGGNVGLFGNSVVFPGGNQIAKQFLGR